jgi:hypothetical protein
MAGSKRSRSGARTTGRRERPEDEIKDSSNGSAFGGIEIDVPEVGPSTKISDLTVEQFVSLLDQVFAQIRVDRKRSFADNKDKVRPIALKRIVEIFQSDDESIVRFRRLLRELGQQVPSILRDVTQQMQKNNK